MYYQLYYKLTAGAYDLLDFVYFRNPEKSPRKAVVSCIGEKESVLDICCGTGANAIKIAKERPDAKVVGADISKEMLAVAKEKRRKAGAPNLKFYHMDATKTEFKDACFDKISMALVLHEMPEELAGRVICELKRLLKDNGELIITEWEPSKIRWQKLLFLPIHLMEPKSYRILLKKDLNAYFKTFGLEIVETKYCDYTKVLRIRKVKSDER